MLIKQVVGDKKGQRDEKRKFQMKMSDQRWTTRDEVLVYASIMATVMRTVLVRRYLGLGSFSWGTVSG